MGDLAGRPPLGLKQPKADKPQRKPLPKVSAKKRAHKATEKAAGAWDHMARVKALPCICCGAPPISEAHHVKDDGKPRSDFRVIPLCQPCHTGPNGYHKAKRSWRERYGRDCDMLGRVAETIKAPPD